MSQPSLPADVEAGIARLSGDIDKVWLKMKREEALIYSRWYYERPPVRVHRLEQMERTVRSLAGVAEETMRGGIGAVQASYETGAWNTALKSGLSARFTLPDIDALARISMDTMDDLLAATQNVRSSTKGLVRELTRDWLNAKIITGKTAEDAGLDLARALSDRGINAITYRNGARYGLTSYTDMVMRTKSAVAYQEGGFQQGRELGIEYWEIMDGPDCGLSYHDDPTLADGMIVNRHMAESYPISHPNCVRVTSPRPDIKSAAEAKAAKRTSSEEQVADQAEASRARVEANALRPRKLGLDRRLANRDNLLTKVPDVRANSLSPAASRNATRIANADAKALSSVPPRAAPRVPAPAAANVPSPADVAAQMVADATAAEPQITKVMTGLAQTHEAELAGLDFRIKGVSSLERKLAGDVADAGVTATEAAKGMFDVNRYTMVLSEERYARTTQRVLDDLHRDGNTLKVKNYWNRTDNPYQGVNVQVTQANGRQYELQFHTPKSLEVKEGELHRIYELRRIETDPIKIAAYDVESFEAASKIPIPPWISGVGAPTPVQVAAAAEGTFEEMITASSRLINVNYKDGVSMRDQWFQRRFATEEAFDASRGNEGMSAATSKIRDKYVVDDDRTLAMLRSMRADGRTTPTMRAIEGIIDESTVLEALPTYRAAVLQEDVVSRLTPGSRWVDKAFQSTDLTRGTAEFYGGERIKDGALGRLVMFHYDLQPGMKARYVGSGEVVVQRNTGFIVDRVVDTGETLEVYLKAAS